MRTTVTLVRLEDFLDAVRHYDDPGPEELERLAGLWQDAHEAAVACLEAMPSIGVLSMARRERCFLVVAELLDARVDSGRLNQEQAQLALTILRMASGRYVKAEAAFVARLGRRDRSELERLSETARHYLHSLRLLQDRAEARQQNSMKRGTVCDAS